MTAHKTLDSHNIPTQLGMLATAEASLRRISSILTTIATAFNDAGYEVYLVGGSVRDALLGKQSKDLDFATNAKPADIKKILGPISDHMWDTGIAFGTISAQLMGHTVEITTFRSDTYHYENGRKPHVSFGTDLDHDLKRRDFTINAMAIELRADGTRDFHDPHHGIADLEKKIIATPDDPHISFQDDPLRMLRAVRFAAHLGFDLDPDVSKTIKAHAQQLERISAERIAAELDKIMLSTDPIAGLEILRVTALADVIIPEIPHMQMTIDEHHQHKDVYRHSLTVLKQAIELEQGEPDLVLRWAAILHDIGKPATRRNEPGGGVSFHHHEIVGAKMARARLRKLKYPKNFIKDVSSLVALHLRFHGYGENTWTDSAVRRYVTDAGELLPRLNKLVRADCTTRNRRRAAALQANYDHLEQRIAELAAQEDLAKIRPALSGEEIMELLNLPPGPQVGRAWKFLKEQRLESGLQSPEEAKEILLQWWSTHNNS